MDKVCPKCKELKDTSLFYKATRQKSGVQVYCKQCQDSYDREARERRKKHGPSIQRDAKICRLCNNKKPISQFGRRTSSADGHLSYCKLCWTEYVKKAKKKMIQ